VKRFKFRLESLLKHRETVQDLREQEFARAQSRHDALKLQLDALEEHYQQTIADRPVAEIGARFDAPRIQSREQYLQAVQLQMARQTEQVEIARLIAEEMRIQMVSARQACEAVTRLRDKDYAEYQAEVQRKTQEELDEIAAVRFTRQQSER
jgi:flagellar FliJ protein